MDQIRIDTPESVDLALEPAGLGSRFLAALVDAVIQYVVLFILLLVAVPALSLSAGPSGDNLGATEAIILSILVISVALLFFLYKLLFEAFWNGQTPGKRVAGLRVVQANGMPVTFLQVLIRNLLRIVDYLPGYYLIGSVCVLATAKKQRLGDMAAGTVVVRDRPAEVPTIPTALTHVAQTDLTRLREHVMRLTEQDLAPARGYWQRRWHMESTARARLAMQIANHLVVRMGWTDPVPPFPDDFIEEVLYVRAR